MKGLPRKVVVVLVPAGLIAGGAWLFTRRTSAPVGTFQTAQIGRGHLVARISATGTLEPEELVDVGAQVAGQILWFGKYQRGRPIDYGSAVKAGTVPGADRQVALRPGRGPGPGACPAGGG